MRMLRLRDASSLLLSLAVVVATTSALTACNIHVKKDSAGQDKQVDIETPIGGLHVNKQADVRDTGLPVYPGARLKEKHEDGQENRANVHISSELFGLRVVAVEYLSDDAPDKLVAYYSGQLKKYGDVLECHSSGNHVSSDMDSDDDNKPLKCEGDNKGPDIELKVGTRRNQHIVAIKPAESGKGTDFGLVYVQVRSGRDTI
jgi:hypothetical protein